MPSLPAWVTRLIFLLVVFGFFLSEELFAGHHLLFLWVKVLCGGAGYINHEITVKSNADGSAATGTAKVVTETIKTEIHTDQKEPTA